MSSVPLLQDDEMMRIALALAERGLGRVAPNPAVGCVLARTQKGHTKIIARGWTQAGGPHAEAHALARAGDSARGATAYVSLEPCAHAGKTPPCTDALLRAGIRRVVCAFEDPDPRVQGRGIAALQKAGIEVVSGILEAEARHLNAGHIVRMEEGRPLVTLKTAASLDGRIATQRGESRWITGAPARRFAHMLRARADAVLIGAETARADNPDLGVRLPGLETDTPVRVVADARLSLPPSSKLLEIAKSEPVWILTHKEAPQKNRAGFESAGARLVDVALGNDGLLDMKDAARALGALGITRLLVEGGARLAASFLRAGLVDRLVWFVAPKLLGAGGVAGIAPLGDAALEVLPAFRLRATRRMGEDVCFTAEAR